MGCDRELQGDRHRNMVLFVNEFSEGVQSAGTNTVIRDIPTSPDEINMHTLRSFLKKRVDSGPTIMLIRMGELLDSVLC